MITEDQYDKMFTHHMDNATNDMLKAFKYAQDNYHFVGDFEQFWIDAHYDDYCAEYLKEAYGF